MGHRRLLLFEEPCRKIPHVKNKASYTFFSNIFCWCSSVFLSPQFFHFLPELQGQGSLRPMASPSAIFRNFDVSLRSIFRYFDISISPAPAAVSLESISNTFPRKASSMPLYICVPSLRYSVSGSRWP